MKRERATKPCRILERLHGYKYNSFVKELIKIYNIADTLCPTLRLHHFPKNEFAAEVSHTFEPQSHFRSEDQFIRQRERDLKNGD